MTETRNSIAETERERDPEVPLQQRASLFLAIMKRQSHSEDRGLIWAFSCDKPNMTMASLGLKKAKSIACYWFPFVAI